MQLTPQDAVNDYSVLGKSNQRRGKLLISISALTSTTPFRIQEASVLGKATLPKQEVFGGYIVMLAQRQEIIAGAFILFINFSTLL